MTKSSMIKIYIHYFSDHDNVQFIFNLDTENFLSAALFYWNRNKLIRMAKFLKKRLVKVRTFLKLLFFYSEYEPVIRI